MTKKDYKMLAEILGETVREVLKETTYQSKPELALSYASGVRNTMEKVMVRLCNALKQDNARFDEDKFYEAVYKK